MFGNIKRACIFHSKRIKFFEERIKYFHLGTRGCYLEYRRAEGTVWKWTYDWAYDWLQGKIGHKDAADQFWWGYREAIRTKDFHNFNVFFDYKLGKK